MNVSLTATCNRTCAFCFANDAMDAAARGSKFMPLPLVDAALDMLVRSGIPEARLLGGEPTLHPQFDAIVERALARGLRLLIFSGGLVPEPALQRLEAVAPSSVSVLLNVLAPGAGRPPEHARQEDVMRRLGRRVILGVTIDSTSVDLDFLLGLITRFDLARIVRLGLAHPTLGGSNTSLLPRQYPQVGRRVAAFAQKAGAVGVRLDFDCGWVPCMFPDGALAAMGKGSDEVGLRCSPIVDVLPDGQVISCYPLASHTSIPLATAPDARWLRTAFAERQHADRHARLYPECESCSWRARGECSGGCLSASLGRQRQRDFSIAVMDAT